MAKGVSEGRRIRLGKKKRRELELSSLPRAHPRVSPRGVHAEKEKPGVPPRRNTSPAAMLGQTPKARETLLCLVRGRLCVLNPHERAVRAGNTRRRQVSLVPINSQPYFALLRTSSRATPNLGGRLL